LTAVVLLLAISNALPAAAQAPTGRVLKVGVANSPPFAILEDDGTWSGLGVELWGRIANDLDLHYELHPTTLEGLAQGLHNGTLDAAIGALAVTPEGTALHDFSQPYLATGLGFAQSARQELSWAAVGHTLLDRRLLSAVGALILSILVVGALIAVIERRHQATDFAGPLRDSVSTGVWWAAVTMTTVGYGDATPKTPVGRALALVWMFVGVIAVAVFTATVTSILTLSHIQGSVDRPADLQRLRVGAVSGGAGSDYLTEHHFHFQPYADYEAALTDLAGGQFDLLVGNRASLRFLIKQSWQGRLRVSPLVLEQESYAIGLPRHSPLRASIDDALVRSIHADSWDEVESRYLGHD
jgi:ABC-type amino acid transport substrate-binding protein